MTDTKDLLIEIGTEEIPPKALTRLASGFATGFEDRLNKSGLKHKEVKWYATPRRLAIIVSELVVRQDDSKTTRRGPALADAFDKNDKPTSAALGFANSCGVEVSELETQKTDKGEWLSFTRKEKGKETKELISDLANQALSQLPIPKRMRWGDNETEFVRPVHWVVVLFGKEIIPCSILGITASNITYGHRFHKPGPIRLLQAGNYLKDLEEKGQVIVDYESRHEKIRQLVGKEADKHKLNAHIDPDLHDEVTSLVEWPVAVTGDIDEKFSELPSEVLVATMQDNQKYFPLYEGEKVSAFVIISNIESKTPEIIKTGNERVIRARLSDAGFFWQRDCSIPLAEYASGLKDVIFQKELGTLADKTERIRKLSTFLASELNVDHKTADRAAMLAKCDLLTDMVGEFPKLQGTMGRYYAIASNEKQEVAIAIGDHYLPRFAGDRLPATDIGQILAIADKLDTLVGIFAIGQLPTGEKDPFGLRRTALGCLRIMIESNLNLDLETCLIFSAGTFDKSIRADSITNDVFEFMMERLRRYYLDSGVSVDIFDAVLECRPTKPNDFHWRIQAVNNFNGLPEAESLAAANKRIKNILRQAGNKITPTIDGSLLIEDAEKELAKELAIIAKKVLPLTENKNYMEALNELSRLRDPVDNFFDNVMVMVDDESLRNTRLQLLASIQHEFKQIADISCLQGK